MMKEYILRIDEYADLNDLSIDDENIVWVNWHYPNGLGESTPEGTIRPYPSPWHTDTPTEEGWYLCWVSYKKEIAPMVYKWKNDKFMLTDTWESDDNILMWQKIEPFKEATRNLDEVKNENKGFQTRTEQVEGPEKKKVIQEPFN